MTLKPRENTDLLIKGSNTTNKQDDKQQQPADGGCRAYAVLVASFITNGLIFSVMNSFSVIYTVLESNLRDDGLSNPESRAALVGSLGMGTTFFMSPFAGVLANFMGLRWTAVFGGCLATIGMFLSSFFVHQVGVLYFTYGILYATGASLVYTPSLAVLGSYFKKRLGLANGFVCIGSSTFTVIMPPIMDAVIKSYGLAWMLRLLALFTCFVIACGFLFKPIPMMVIKRTKEDNNWKAICKTIINVHIWKIKPYRAWAFCIPIALCGYFVPYVHIKKFIIDNFADVNANLPLQCLAFASGVGRLLFGYLADKPGVDPIILQQISFYSIGIATIVLPFVRNFPLLVIVSLFMGVFDGAFVALMGPIAVALCGGAHAAQSIGYMLGMASLPLSLGPPVAGLLYSAHKSYTLPFVLAGIFPLLGATLMFSIHYLRRSDRKSQRENVATPLTTRETGQNRPILKKNKASL